MRIGHGFDAHEFQDDGKLVLGGVEIPFDRGLKAHSDGDVIIHALCDAVLGAAALGDLGAHFSDTDPAYSNIDSRVLLRHVFKLISDQSYFIGNVDLTVVAQSPRMAPHVPAMKQNIAADLELSTDAVNIKATTTEGMGFTGRGEGIAVFAVVLLKQDSQ